VVGALEQLRPLGQRDDLDPGRRFRPRLVADDPYLLDVAVALTEAEPLVGVAFGGPDGDHDARPLTINTGGNGR
jgi:hypothetical protein